MKKLMTTLTAVGVCVIVLALAGPGGAASQRGNAAQTGGRSLGTHAAAVVLPNVVGLRMDISTRLLHARGLRVNEECPKATFGCWIKANWWICRQYPRAGIRIARYSTVITYGVRHRTEG